MEANREKAWSHLTDVEKQSIYLTLGQGLSGMQACEILQITKYKFLELKARSETLFRIFTDYFTMYSILIRPACPLKPAFRDFIYACLEKRLPLPEANIYAGEGKWSRVNVREVEVIGGMELLKKSESKHDNDLFALIQEFDRWNNFRILPYCLQMPSPYRRKGNRLAKNYFRYLRNINPNTLFRIATTLQWAGHKKWYISLISETLENGYKVIPIEASEKNKTTLSIQRLYIFKEALEATEFALVVIRQPTVNASREGVDFWKTYTTLIQKAINYEAVSHTNKVKDFYDDSFKESYR